MRIIHLSESDAAGGAAKGAYNLHRGLCAIGADSHMLVGRKMRSDAAISGNAGALSQLQGQLRHGLDQLPVYLQNPSRLRRPLNPLFSTGIMPQRVLKKLKSLNPDVVIIHWVNRGFFPFWLLEKLPYPHIIFARDMWWFTGGCHIPPESCEKFYTICGACPQLNSALPYDLSSLLHSWKKRVAARAAAPRHLFVLSEWMGAIARRSLWGEAGTPVHVFGNAIDTDIFKPLPQAAMRDLMGIPADKKIIAFSALDFDLNANKGADLLRKALQSLGSLDNTAVMLLGGAASAAWEKEIALPVYSLGKLQDETSLAAAYNAADVVAVPSRYEPYGKTAAEALACGVPVVCFDAAGTKDLVRHQQSGYLAQSFDTADFANGLKSMLALDNAAKQAVSDNAREGIVRQASARIQGQALLDYCAAQGWGRHSGC